MNTLALATLLAFQAPSTVDRFELEQLENVAFNSAFAGAGKVVRRVTLEIDGPRGWVEVLQFHPDWSAGSASAPAVLQLRHSYAEGVTHRDPLPLEVGKRYVVFASSIGHRGAAPLRIESDGLVSVSSYGGGIFAIENGRLCRFGESMLARILDGLEEGAARRLMREAYAAADSKRKDAMDQAAMHQATGMDTLGDSVIWAGSLKPKLGVPFQYEPDDSAIHRNRWYRGVHPISWDYMVPREFEEATKLFDGYQKRPFEGTPLQGGKDAWYEKAWKGVHQTVSLRWSPHSKGTHVSVIELPLLTGEVPDWPPAVRPLPDIAWLKPPLHQLAGKAPVFVHKPELEATAKRRILTVGYLVNGEPEDILRGVLEELGPGWTSYTRSDSLISLSRNPRRKEGWYAFRIEPLGLKGGADRTRSLVCATWAEPKQKETVSSMERLRQSSLVGPSRKSRTTFINFAPTAPSTTR